MVVPEGSSPRAEWQMRVSWEPRTGEMPMEMWVPPSAGAYSAQWKMRGPVMRFSFQERTRV